MRLGKLNRRVTFERAARTINPEGQETGALWSPICKAWAHVKFQLGSERRAAATEQASSSATFITRWNSTLASIKETDRIIYNSTVWDIHSIVLGERNEALEFTATRLNG